jgi:pimeloyl-ACP methyl ester carboxylesterase
MLPETDRPPVIVMAHGFANVYAARLPEFASRFVEAGYAVFLFDYRTFGESEGKPRHLVHPWQQIEDWHAAIEHLKSRREIDSSRVALWGTSFSGGHVLKLAADRKDIAAVISQIPHVSGPATSLQAHPMTTIKCTLAAMIDLAGSVFGKPFYSAITGKPGDRAAITGDNAVESYSAMLPDGVCWENRVLSRSFLYVPMYSPRNSARKITAPTLIIGASRDSVVPVRAAWRASRRIPSAEFKLLDADHFQPYFGELFEQNAALQLDFLNRHLPTS